MQQKQTSINFQTIGLPVFALGPAETLVARNAVAERLLKRKPLPRLSQGLIRKLKHRARPNDKNLYEWNIDKQTTYDLCPLQHGKSPILLLLDARSRIELETRMRQTARIQATGQFAGGIAHDFNNLLTAILAQCDLILEQGLSKELIKQEIKGIKDNSERAHSLIKQLLAFSREQVLDPKAWSIDLLFSGISTLLERISGATITMKVTIEPGLNAIYIDRGQFEQILINLVINARDAMPLGGSIEIVVCKTYIKEGVTCRDSTIPAGEYIQITVTDSGSGVEESNLENIFDPFFSTKQVGEGSGLGLAVSDGIMRQSNAFISAHNSNEPLKGLQLTLLFPHIQLAQPFAKSVKAQPARTIQPRSPRNHKAQGAVSILLVEDESPVRAIIAKFLRYHGYSVIETESSETAIEIAKNNKVDLVITDLVMPSITGDELIRLLRQRQQHLPAICMSGYAEIQLISDVKQLPRLFFLSKPFAMRDLLKIIEKASITQSTTEPKTATR